MYILFKCIRIRILKRMKMCVRPWKYARLCVCGTVSNVAKNWVVFVSPIFPVSLPVYANSFAKIAKNYLKQQQDQQKSYHFVATFRPKW